MATFDFVVDDTMVGTTIGPADGFLVNLTQTTPSPVYMVPEGNDGSGAWTRGYLQIRGSGDVRDLFCYQPATGGHLSGVMVQNRSLAYRGNLVVRCVPRGSVWNITLSDVFYKPPPPAWPLWSPLREPLSRERELVLR